MINGNMPKRSETQQTVNRIYQSRKIFTINLSVTILFLLLCVSASFSKNINPETAQKLHQIFTQHHIVRGDFTQSKEMQALNAPLTSQGHFVFAHQNGIIWTTVNPFQTSYIITQKGIKKIDADSSVTQNITEDIFATTKQLMAGNFESLSRMFTINFHETAHTWELILSPRRGRLKRILASISLTGTTSGFIQTLTMTSMQGTQTSLRFSDTSAGTTLSVEEEALFVQN